MTRLWLTGGNAAADALLSEDPNALLIGMLLDQQVPMEKAFSGPQVIAERMGGRLDVAAIAAADPEEFAALCAEPPAVHRFPRAMAGRIQDLCRVLVDGWGGNAGQLFDSAGTGAELVKKLSQLPGFGPVKAQIFTALLGKQYGVTPAGWREAAGEFGTKGHWSVADVVDEESLQLVRAAKKAAKAAKRAAHEG